MNIKSNGFYKDNEKKKFSIPVIITYREEEISEVVAFASPSYPPKPKCCDEWEIQPDGTEKCVKWVECPPSAVAGVRS